MKITHLSPTSSNMSSIGEVSERLGKTFLTSLAGNHWATGGTRVNSTPDYGTVSWKNNHYFPLGQSARKMNMNKEGRL